MGAELNETFGALLATLEGRMREIAEDVVRKESHHAVGAVKVKRAAELLDMNEWRVRQLIRDGKLQVIHPTPKTIRVPLSSISRFLEEQS